MPRFCQHLGCNKRAGYGDREYNKILYCLTHKRPNDVNLKHKRCAAIGCDKIPSFGSRLDGKVLYCANHKRITDMNLTSKRCTAMNCDKIPAFGDAVDGKRLFCGNHKRPTDINLSKRAANSHKTRRGTPNKKRKAPAVDKVTLPSPEHLLPGPYTSRMEWNPSGPSLDTYNPMYTMHRGRQSLHENYDGNRPLRHQPDENSAYSSLKKLQIMHNNALMWQENNSKQRLEYPPIKPLPISLLLGP